MKIEKFRFSPNGGEDIPLLCKIDESNFEPRFKTLIRRDGYKIRPEKGEGDIHYIKLFSPKGMRRVETSRGFRTYYRITCDNFPQFEQIIQDLVYKYEDDEEG
jgi:hypothetical protein